MHITKGEFDEFMSAVCPKFTLLDNMQKGENIFKIRFRRFVIHEKEIMKETIWCFDHAGNPKPLVQELVHPCTDKLLLSCLCHEKDHLIKMIELDDMILQRNVMINGIEK